MPQRLMYMHFKWLTCIGVVQILLAGCSTDSVPRKDYDAATIAAEIIYLHDQDSNGRLTEAELADCLAMATAVSRIDKDGDETVSTDEIRDRVSSYGSMSKYIVSDLLVTRANRPVEGASVTLQLIEAMQADETRFVATTDASGLGTPRSEPIDLLGFPPGLYDVVVTEDSNSHRFGVELADDNPDVGRLHFDLSNKQKRARQ